MTPWIPLTTQPAVDALMEGFASFHDACLCQVSLVTTRSSMTSAAFIVTAIWTGRL